MKKLILMLAIVLPMVLVSCSDDENGSQEEPTMKVDNLPEMGNVSLNYHPSEQTLTLS